MLLTFLSLHPFLSLTLFLSPPPSSPQVNFQISFLRPALGHVSSEMTTYTEYTEVRVTLFFFFSEKFSLQSKILIGRLNFQISFCSPFVMNLQGEGKKKSIFYSTSFIPRRLKDFSCKVKRSEEKQIYKKKTPPS